MSWNNAKEYKKFEKEQEELAAWYRSVGMTEEQILEMYEFDKKEFFRRRSNNRVLLLSDLSSTTEEGITEVTFEELGESSEDELDPFVFGFDDPRLNRIYKKSDEISRKIMRCLAQGMSKVQIAQELGVVPGAISHRIDKMKKYF